jgi:hypothetical protein
MFYINILQPLFHAENLNIVASWRWLQFAAKTCRSEYKSTLQSAGNKLVY